MGSPVRVESAAGGSTLAVTVVPGASREEVVGPHGDTLKVRVAAPPEGGRANDAVCALVARALGLRAADVEVRAGATARRKTLAIRGVGPDAVRAALGI